MTIPRISTSSRPARGPDALERAEGANQSVWGSSSGKDLIDGGNILAQAWEDSNTLNSIAWKVVDDEGVKERNLEFAMKAAVRANELTESKDAAILDTLARVFYEQGALDKAIEWQKKSAEHAKSDSMGADIRKTLEKYIKENEEF